MCSECSICEKEIASCSSDKNPLNWDSGLFEDSPFKNYSVLMGNGIILSHEAGEEFKFKYSEIEPELTKIYEEYREKKGLECPEEFLNIVRIELSIAILGWYQERFVDENNKMNVRALSNFVKPFQNIFTLNYDPIAYRSIFNKDGISFKDGFRTQPKSDKEIAGELKLFLDSKVDISTIESVLKDDKCIYFLHGAFHILSMGVDSYMKIETRETKNLIETVQEKYKEIIDEFRQNGSSSRGDPLCVLSSSSMNKRAWIEDDPYLSFCLERLGEQKKVITLGCAFAKDDHILEALLLNDSLEDLKIGVFQELDRENVCEAFERIKKSPRNKTKILKRKISFFCTKNLKNIIWQKESCFCQKDRPESSK